MEPAELVERLAAIVGPGSVSRSEPDRVTYSGDMWPRLQIWKSRGVVCRHPPDCVVWPASVDEVAAVLRLCNDERIPVVPYGAGSGVCGGTVPISGGVVVDVRRLDAIYRIHGESLTLDVGAGVVGHLLEQALSERGFTLGHFPSSILCSTVGGWVAARSAGQLSSMYGKIEDMVLGLEVVLANGDVLHMGELGPLDGAVDWTPLFVGSEGTLGVITRVLLRIHPAPAVRSFRGMRFRSVGDGLEGMRRVMQAGLAPSVLRLYDPFDTLIAGGKGDKDDSRGIDALLRFLRPSPSEAPSGLSRLLHERLQPLRQSLQKEALHAALTHPALLNRVAGLVPVGARLIVGFEGEEATVRTRMAEAQAILAASGASDEGEEPGKHWYEHRYDVSFKQSKVFTAGAFSDTMEVACPWSRVAAVYDAVRARVSAHGFIMAHFSHAYREGCSIYFTFAGFRPASEDLELLYDRVWSEAQRAASEEGATLSHHHGVGLSKRALMAEEHGQGERIFAALKRTFDTNGIMNPGKVFAGRYHKGRRGGTAG
ncbi:MAG: hypothetical protein AMXMBFR64_26550 [Myxococcales bacterium]